MLHLLISAAEFVEEQDHGETRWAGMVERIDGLGVRGRTRYSF